jgi:hypothetical protein
VHVYAVEHVEQLQSVLKSCQQGVRSTHPSPLILIIRQIVFAQHLSSLPIMPDQLLQHDRLAERDVDVPFLKPPSAVGGATYRCTDFAGKMCLFVNGHPVACSPERGGCCEAACVMLDGFVEDADVGAG